MIPIEKYNKYKEPIRVSQFKAISLTENTPLIIIKEIKIKIKEAVLVPITVFKPARKPSLILALTTNTVTGPGVPKKVQ